MLRKSLLLHPAHSPDCTCRHCEDPANVGAALSLDKLGMVSEVEPVAVRNEEFLRDLLAWGIQQLEILGPAEARVNAERLLEEVTGLGRFEINLGNQFRISKSEIRKNSKFEFQNSSDFVLRISDFSREYRRLVALRRERIPLAYLTGRAYFWNEALEVGPGCLIPRPETEILVERFIERSGFGKDECFHFLDLGCGSGAVGIALLRHFPNARAVFSDISKDALEITRKNLSRYALPDRAEVVESDLFQDIRRGTARRASPANGNDNKKRSDPPVTFDAILSNPPYVAERDWGMLEPEVLREPAIALDGGPDGLDFYRRIISEVGARRAVPHLKPRGLLALEVGIGQARKVSQWLFENGLDTGLRIFQDHNGVDRVVMARRNP